MTPRLARLAFGGAFATAGSAIRSGDEYNGASIVTCECFLILLLPFGTSSILIPMSNFSDTSFFRVVALSCCSGEPNQTVS